MELDPALKHLLEGRFGPVIGNRPANNEGSSYVLNCALIMLHGNGPLCLKRCIRVSIGTCHISSLVSRNLLLAENQDQTKSKSEAAYPQERIMRATYPIGQRIVRTPCYTEVRAVRLLLFLLRVFQVLSAIVILLKFTHLAVCSVN